MIPEHLFIKLYLDEDVSVLLTELLRPHGFDIQTARDARNLGQPDAAQLLYASSLGRAILTHNRTDFEALHRAALDQHQFHAGIILANRRASDADLARRVLKLLDLFAADDAKNQLFYI